MTIYLPFKLTEGTKAYAAKVMANFYALVSKLNGLSVNGDLLDLETALSLLWQLVDSAVKSGEAGNAGSIRFTDGLSLQEYLDSGLLHGKDAPGTVQDGYCYFYVDDAGHLQLVCRDDVDEKAYSINEEGHLIYTIGDHNEEEAGVITYDLGNVRGPQGDKGDMDSSIYDPMGHKMDIFKYVDEKLDQMKTREQTANAYALDWTTENGVTSCEVAVTGLSATAKFDVWIAPSATAEQESAFNKAMLKVGSVEADKFTLLAGSGGAMPTVDLPLVVRIYP